METFLFLSSFIFFSFSFFDFFRRTDGAALKDGRGDQQHREAAEIPHGAEDDGVGMRVACILGDQHPVGAKGHLEEESGGKKGLRRARKTKEIKEINHTCFKWTWATTIARTTKANGAAFAAALASAMFGSVVNRKN